MRTGYSKQGREEEASQYRERIEAIEEILSEFDRQEQERVAGLRKSHAEVNWRNPSEAMRKVGAGSPFFLPSSEIAHARERIHAAGNPNAFHVADDSHALLTLQHLPVDRQPTAVL